jgi:hypothetical protein
MLRVDGRRGETMNAAAIKRTELMGELALLPEEGRRPP